MSLKLRQAIPGRPCQGVRALAGVWKGEGAEREVYYVSTLIGKRGRMNAEYIWAFGRAEEDIVVLSASSLPASTCAF